MKYLKTYDRSEDNRLVRSILITSINYLENKLKNSESFDFNQSTRIGHYLEVVLEIQ